MVIPIGSNIPLAIEASKDTSRPICVHFGLIMPGKGVEQFLELASAMKGSRVVFELIGSVPTNFGQFGSEISRRARDLGVNLRLGETDGSVSYYLARAAYGYLPFPGGATERRGSLLACISNRVSVLTTHSDQTPDWIRHVTVGVETPQQAGDVLLRLISDGKTQIYDNLEETRNRFSWHTIGKRHLDLYRELSSRRSKE